MTSAGFFLRHRLLVALWPGRAIAMRAAITAAALWLLLHAFLTLSTGGGSSPLSPPAAVGLVVIAWIAGLVDSKRKHETILLQNIGVSPLSVPLIWSVVIVLLEGLLLLVPEIG